MIFEAVLGAGEGKKKYRLSCKHSTATSRIHKVVIDFKMTISYSVFTFMYVSFKSKLQLNIATVVMIKQKCCTCHDEQDTGALLVWLALLQSAHILKQIIQLDVAVKHAHAHH